MIRTIHQSVLSVRGLLSVLGIVFATSLALRGLWWTEMPRIPALMLAGIILFIAVLIISVMTEDDSSGRLQRGVAILVIGATAVIPSLTGFALDRWLRTAPFATWYIGGLGMLAVVLIVRRRMLCGWVATGLLALGSSLWLGFIPALQLGLVGSITWVLAAHLMTILWDRAITDVQKLTAIQESASAERAAEAERQRERRLRIQYALRVAGPILTRTIETQGDLDPEDRLAARLSEGRLRDELRGAGLLDDVVRYAIDAGRSRGAEVTVLDDGGMEDIAPEWSRKIREQIATILMESTSSRIIVRSVPDPQIAVTIVGRDSDAAEESNVELWVEIPRHPR